MHNCRRGVCATRTKPHRLDKCCLAGSDCPLHNNHSPDNRYIGECRCWACRCSIVAPLVARRIAKSALRRGANLGRRIGKRRPLRVRLAHNSPVPRWHYRRHGRRLPAFGWDWHFAPFANHLPRGLRRRGVAHTMRSAVARRLWLLTPENAASGCFAMYRQKSFSSFSQTYRARAPIAERWAHVRPNSHRYKRQTFFFAKK